MVRFKNRYVVVDVDVERGWSERSTVGKATRDALGRALHENFGDVLGGVANASVSVKHAHAESGVVLVRCSTSSARVVRAAIGLMRGDVASARGASGTLKRAKEACARRAKEKMSDMVARGKMNAREMEDALERQKKALEACAP